jgi:spore maturation protein CgeB
LRILVVLPLYGGSLPIGRYCVSALKEMGHVVRVFDGSLFQTAFTGMRKLELAQDRVAQLENAFLHVVSQAVWAQVEPLEPHLVLAVAQAPLGRHLLQRLKRAGIPTVMWFMEDFRTFTYWKSYAPMYDAFAVIQREPFVSLLAQEGQRNVLYLPMAADPSFHRPVTLTPEQRRIYEADIGFLGSGYPNRRLAFRELAGKDFKIWGTEWEEEPRLAKVVQRGGARIDEEEAVLIYNGAKVNLNLHSSLNANAIVTGGDFVNPRTFELAAMEAFQLVDERSLLGECFTPEEVATFRDIGEMHERIGHFLKHPEERREFARRARERVLAEHTYVHRMRTLLDFMAERFGVGAEPADGGAAEAGRNAPEVGELLRTLGLGPNASFGDVVHALRGRHGALTETEMGVLFLDEWRKLYAKK